MGMKVVTWSRYIGELIGNREAEDTWLIEKSQGCAELVKTLSGVDQNH